MNNIVKLENNNLMINYNKSDDLILDILLSEIGL